MNVKELKNFMMLCEIGMEKPTLKNLSKYDKKIKRNKINSAIATKRFNDYWANRWSNEDTLSQNKEIYNILRSL